MKRCDGRYPVPGKRDEPFDVTYRCGRAPGHDGPHGPEDPPDFPSSPETDALRPSALTPLVGQLSVASPRGGWERYYETFYRAAEVDAHLAELTAKHERIKEMTLDSQGIWEKKYFDMKARAEAAEASLTALRQDYAQVKAELEKAEGKALAYDDIERRGSEAFDYAQANAEGRYGQNIWHIALEDAIRFRAALTQAQARRQQVITECTTTTVPSEWDAALKWRDRFLNGDDDDDARCRRFRNSSCAT